jgi:hypothetical protein
MYSTECVLDGSAGQREDLKHYLISSTHQGNDMSTTHRMTFASATCRSSTRRPWPLMAAIPEGRFKIRE